MQNRDGHINQIKVAASNLDKIEEFNLISHNIKNINSVRTTTSKEDIYLYLQQVKFGGSVLGDLQQKTPLREQKRTGTGDGTIIVFIVNRDKETQ